MKKGQVQVESIFMTLVSLFIFVLTVVVLFRNTSNLNALLGYSQSDVVASILLNRLISSPDCLAYERVDYNFASDDIVEYRRVYPGVIDFNKFRNWNDPSIDHINTFNSFQCISYWIDRKAVLFPSGEIKDYEAFSSLSLTILDAENGATYALESGKCLNKCTPTSVTLPVKIKMPDGAFHYGVFTAVFEFGSDILEEDTK